MHLQERDVTSHPDPRLFHTRPSRTASAHSRLQVGDQRIDEPLHRLRAAHARGEGAEPVTGAWHVTHQAVAADRREAAASRAAALRTKTTFGSQDAMNGDNVPDIPRFRAFHETAGVGEIDGAGCDKRDRIARRDVAVQPRVRITRTPVRCRTRPIAGGTKASDRGPGSSPPWGMPCRSRFPGGARRRSSHWGLCRQRLGRTNDCRNA